MARPVKEGLDYYPVSVNMWDDDKLKLTVAAHPPGVACAVLTLGVLPLLYGGRGYYLPWTEREQLMVSMRSGFDIETVRAVVSSAVKWGFFSENLCFRHGILSSVGIQNRFLMAAGKRSAIRFVRDFCLLTLSEGEIKARKVVFASETPIFGEKTLVKGGSSTQRKEKEKEKGKVPKTVSGEKTPSDEHPSPSAPTHLSRKREELISVPFPTHPGACWMTEREWEDLQRQIGEVAAGVLACEMDDLAESKPSVYKQYKSHKATLLNWHKLRVADGKEAFVHPTHGAGYYKLAVINQLTNGGRQV